MAEDDQLGYWRVLCITLGIIIGLYLIFLASEFIFKRFFKRAAPVLIGIACFW